MSSVSLITPTMSPSNDPAVVTSFMRYAVHSLTLAEQEIFLSFILGAVVLVTGVIDAGRPVTGLSQTKSLLEGNSTST